jgi:hypothetical protein
VVLALAGTIFATAGVFLVIAEHSAIAWFWASFFAAAALVLVLDLFPNNPLERRRKARRPARYPKVSFDGQSIVVGDRNAVVTTLALSELERIVILTTSEGPYVCDVFWVLESDAAVCSFASESEGANAVVSALMALPGFDYGAGVLAAGSVSESIFPVWKRVDGTPNAGLRDD